MSIKKEIISIACAASILASGAAAAPSAKAATFGDLTGDNQVTAEDATKLLIDFAKTLTGEKSSLDLYVADVNFDGKISAEDATLMLIYFATSLTDGSVKNAGMLPFAKDNYSHSLCDKAIENASKMKVIDSQFADFDKNGVKESVAVVGYGNVVKAVYQCTTDGTIGNYYNITGNILTSLKHLSFLTMTDGKTFACVDVGSDISGWTTFVFGVNSKGLTQLSISNTIQGLYQEGSKLLATKAEISGSSVRYAYYNVSYNPKTMQFTLGSKTGTYRY